MPTPLTLDEIQLEKYGRLEVVDEARSIQKMHRIPIAGHRTPQRRPYYIRVMQCLCDCGEAVEVQLRHLRSGKRKTCGTCRKTDAQAEEDNRARTGARLYTYKGETLCITDWAKRVRLSPATLTFRLVNARWSVRRALLTPKGRWGEPEDAIPDRTEEQPRLDAIAAELSTMTGTAYTLTPNLEEGHKHDYIVTADDGTEPHRLRGYPGLQLSAAFILRRLSK